MQILFYYCYPFAHLVTLLKGANYITRGSDCPLWHLTKERQLLGNAHPEQFSLIWDPLHHSQECYDSLTLTIIKPNSRGRSCLGTLKSPGNTIAISRMLATLLRDFYLSLQ